MLQNISYRQMRMVGKATIDKKNVLSFRRLKFIAAIYIKLQITPPTGIICVNVRSRNPNPNLGLLISVASLIIDCSNAPIEATIGLIIIGILKASHLNAQRFALPALGRGDGEAVQLEK